MKPEKLHSRRTPKRLLTWALLGAVSVPVLWVCGFASLSVVALLVVLSLLTQTEGIASLEAPQYRRVGDRLYPMSRERHRSSRWGAESPDRDA
jgi:hypothetical protein